MTPAPKPRLPWAAVILLYLGVLVWTYASVAARHAPEILP